MVGGWFRYIAGVVGVLGFLWAQAAQAQIKPPPRHDTSSPDGVSYRTGVFSYSELDLSVGGDGDDGLSLTRSYNSGSDGPSDVLTGATGWTHSLLGYVSARRDIAEDPDADPPEPGTEPYIYTVTFGGRSYGFAGGSQYQANVSTTGGPVGTYYPLDVIGSSLVFNGTNASGNYQFKSEDGVIVTFRPTANGRIASIVKPDGTRLDYTYNGLGNIQSVISNHGFAILFETGKACAVNMAYAYITPTSACPSNAQSVTYAFQSGVFGQKLISATKAGGTTLYGYNGFDKLTCITDPGKAACKIQNTYNSCPNNPAYPYPQREVHNNDAVILQSDAAGRTISYQYGYNFQGGLYTQGDSTNLCTVFNPQGVDHRAYRNSTVKMTVNGSTETNILIDPSSTELKITDPLNRVSYLGFWTDGKISNITYPEGNSETYTRDGHGNVTSSHVGSKPGSGLPAIDASAVYPCLSAATCNKPTSVTDAKGNVSTFTYDSTHGGVLTETSPAVGGVSSQKRYEYAQRYAWVKNSGGTYSQAATPIWVKTKEKFCKTSSPSGSNCAAGASDEVVTEYDYGPNSGPNNLLVRGIAVTADGVTLRTCIGYDEFGRKISETKPNANLSSCP